MSYQNEMGQIKAILDGVSPSFCIAKWNQATLHLESGFNHSCHHPKPHKTSEREVRKTVAALHNTEKKRKFRKQMIQGKRPAECGYCWKVEDLGQKNLFSDRVLKSSDSWALPFLDEIRRDPLNPEFLPKYLELSFSNTCNLKCSYCSANYSSSWMKELKEKGNYSTLTGKSTQKIYEESENFYLKAFWEWWPRLHKSLRVLRITGGEPLLSENTFRLLDELEANPNPELVLAINSNLSVSRQVLKRFTEKLHSLERNKSVQRIDLYTSVEAVGGQAEYIRYGLRYSNLIENVQTILSDFPSLNVTIMSTFNALSVFSFTGLLKKVHEWNSVYSTDARPRPVRMDISVLHEPRYQSVQILPMEFRSYFDEISEFIQKNSVTQTGKPQDFGDNEVLKFKRVYEMFLKGDSVPLKTDLHKLFYIFFSEHDQRRGTNILQSFPEISDFWQQCQSAIPFGKEIPLMRRMMFETYRVKRKIYEFF